jgi:hypothetical protein
MKYKELFRVNISVILLQPKSENLFLCAEFAETRVQNLSKY